MEDGLIRNALEMTVVRKSETRMNVKMRTLLMKKLPREYFYS